MPDSCLSHGSKLKTKNVTAGYVSDTLDCAVEDQQTLHTAPICVVPVACGSRDADRAPRLCGNDLTAKFHVLSATEVAESVVICITNAEESHVHEDHIAGAARAAVAATGVAVQDNFLSFQHLRPVAGSTGSISNRRQQQ